MFMDPDGDLDHLQNNSIYFFVIVNISEKSRSIHTFLSYIANRQETNKQANKCT